MFHLPSMVFSPFNARFLSFTPSLKRQNLLGGRNRGGFSPSHGGLDQQRIGALVFLLVFPPNCLLMYLPTGQLAHLLPFSLTIAHSFSSSIPFALLVRFPVHSNLRLLLRSWNWNMRTGPLARTLTHHANSFARICLHC